MYILSADFGTTSLKLAVLDEALHTVASRRVAYACDVGDGGKVEIPPERVLGAFIEGMKTLSGYAGGIEAFVFCVFCPSLLPMDREGNPLYPIITHLDRRSVVQAKRALARVGKGPFLGISGNIPFPGGISLTSILWLKDTHPGLYESTYRFGHLNTYLHGIFTGFSVIDPTNASFTGLYETIKWGGWSEELCGILGIDRSKLPEIRPSASVVGGLSAAAAKATGLKSGIPVLMGANDTASAAFGAGVVESGAILNISGSNEIITIAADTPLPSEKVYLRTHVIEGRWLLLAITVGGGALEWFRREFYGELDRQVFYDRFLPDFIRERFAPDGTASATSCGVTFSPYLAGDRHSIEQRKAAFEGFTLESKKGDFLAALLLGIFEPLTMLLDLYKDRIELKKEIILTGGLASGAWEELKKRVFAEFQFRRVRECSTIGNGRIALLALGI